MPVAVALIALSCSKTQDTAPERRIFGAPPTIESVEFCHMEGTQCLPGFGPKAFISCDFSQIVVDNLCELGRDFGIGILTPQSGGGWTCDPDTGTCKGSDNPTTQPGIFIQGTYGEAIFKVKVTDPDSTSTQNNVLMVSSSFVQRDSTSEISLILLDDGAINRFPNAQKLPTPGETCAIAPDSTCTCSTATYDVTSGDDEAKNNVWTRKMAFPNPKTQYLLQDCIMRDRHETLQYTPEATTYSFTIEAVDRQGNLATWPTKFVGVTDNKIGDFACNGDPCGCCYLFFGSDFLTHCNGLPGMTSDSLPMGLCNAFG
jgi:hypothetical protein